ncbi:MAG: toprim domain-containing protein [Gemmataceae bacterium]
MVATMGTALNARHVKKLRGLVSRVVLVFDADAGGEGGVDRAMEVFVSQEVDLRIATLPEGLDPCDLLVQQGADPFLQVLHSAVDVFEFKLRRVWQREKDAGVEGQRRAVEQMLGILAACPEERNLKIDLMVNRIAHRLGLKEEKLWQQLREMRAAKGRGERQAARPPEESERPVEIRSAPAARHEVELLQVVLAEPGLLPQALEQIPLAEVEHPGLRQLLERLAELQQEGKPADLDHLRSRLDNEPLMRKALELQDTGLTLANRQDVLAGIVERIRHKRAQRHAQTIKTQVMAAQDHDQAIELLKRLQPNAEGKMKNAE